MTILGRGDLAPPRRHGRRRRWPWALLVVVLLAAGGWFGWHLWRTDDGSSAAARVTPCGTASPPPVPADPHHIRLRVLNGTKRNGLAHDVMKELHRRGFRVGKVGNTKPTPKTAVVSARGDLARVIAVRVELQQFHWSPVAKPGAPLTLVIGHDFTGLAPRDRAAQQHVVAVRAAHPSASPCPSARAS